MDSFEPVRQAAVELHDRVVKAGAEPLQPMSLVEHAVSCLELELYWLAKDDPALKGAKALYDEQSGSVCCENEGSTGERAALVAHEIGHVSLHTTGAVCSAKDVDASKSLESAPVGLQRVEDYGVHERRELQANVFAREFLLPRNLARRLYLDDKMGAEAIAVRTGLHRTMLRQQLLDALLLPITKADEAKDAQAPATPDPSQDRAASHRGSAFQLQAGPGTGKTRTLVKHVVSLLNEGIHPSAILILTFSNRAAGELSERIAAAVPNDVSGIWIGTFHAFGLDLVRRYHQKLGLPSEPAPFDRSDAIAVLQEVLPTLPLVHYRNLWDPELILREIITAISRAKDEMTDPAAYKALAEKMLTTANSDEEIEAAEKCLEIARVYELYEQAIRRHEAVDFGDLIMRPTLLLESDKNVRAAVQLRHRHVLVDEYQDVNHASTRFLKVISGDGKRLWVVGDARQSIYRFRGASSSNMAAFAAQYPNAKADQLLVNYRSTQQIVDSVVAIAPKMGASRGMLPLSLTASRGQGSMKPEIRRYANPDLEAEGIAATVREYEKRGVCLRDQAVLCRSNTRLNEIASALEARGIPVLHLGSLFERDEIRDLLSLLSLAVDDYGEGIVRMAANPRYGIPLQDVRTFTTYLRESASNPLEVLQALDSVKELSPEGTTGLEQLAKDLVGLRRESTPWEFLTTYLLDRCDLTRSLAESRSISDWMKGVAIWQFMNFVRDQPQFGATFPIRRLLDRVRQLVLLAEERDLRQVPSAALHMDAVRLMTVHGSKGLEFEAVHIPGLTVSSFPLSYRGQRCPPPVGMIAGSTLSVKDEAKNSHEDEEQCLFFVALSRSRSFCTFHLSQTMAGGNKRNPSPYLQWLPSNLVVEVNRPSTLPLPSDAVRPAPITVNRPEDWHVTDSELKAYEKCPRRYFYTHELGLRGARKTTAFSQTHDCIYELIGWLADARRAGDITVKTAEVAFEEIWGKRGPVEHGFAADYRRLASGLIEALIKASAGRVFRDSEPIAIDFQNGRVVVRPDELAELPDGSVVLRRLRTGQKRSDEYDRLDYTLYHLAGKRKYGSRYRVEALHLTDDRVETVEVTSRKLQTRTEKSDAMLAQLAAGWFLPDVNSVTCPRCPHFFICAATPKGVLKIA